MIFKYKSDSFAVIKWAFENLMKNKIQIIFFTLSTNPFNY